MSLTLRQFEVFQRVALTGSFTQAAADLRLSQPVVSRTIGDIERHVGARLLDRTTRSVEMTSAGREFLLVAQRILERADWSSTGSPRTARASTATSRSPPYPRSPPSCCRRSRRASSPSTRASPCTCSTAPPAKSWNTCARAQPTSRSPTRARPRPGSTFARWWRTACSPSCPWATATAPALTRWSDLAAERFIAFSRDSSVRRLTDLGFAQAGVEPETLVETRAVATAGGMIATGLGISAMPELVLPLLSFTDLNTRPLESPADYQNAGSPPAARGVAPAGREATRRPPRIRVQQAHRAPR